LSSTDELTQEIRRLAAERRAVILAHNYQLPEVQDLADFVGDSLELSRRAAAGQAEVIVFCGVHFMAETAAILNPGRVVLLPDRTAGCPMADMITAADLRELKRAHPGAVVVCYVNSSAEVKAESDICCTSANAEAVVRTIPPDRKVLFVPDRYLGRFVMERTGRDLVLWPGYCPTHARLLPEDIARARAGHPGAVVMVHPECTGPVCAAADAVLSTGGMLRYAARSPARDFIVGTETGLLHRLAKENPGKRFFPAADRVGCPNMKKCTAEKVLWSLRDLEPRVAVSEPVAARARAAIERMLEVPG